MLFVGVTGNAALPVEMHGGRVEEPLQEIVVRRHGFAELLGLVVVVLVAEVVRLVVEDVELAPSEEDQVQVATQKSAEFGKSESLDAVDVSCIQEAFSGVTPEHCPQ